MGNVINEVRKNRTPWLVHAKVPLLNHHTSGVRKDFYRSEEDLAKDAIDDPLPKLKKLLLENEIGEEELEKIETDMGELVSADFMKALNSPEPDIKKAADHVFIPTEITEKKAKEQLLVKKK
jgi:2-oxoisovalerate dehydrogenase E1 component